MGNYLTLDRVVPRSISKGNDLIYLAGILVDLTLPDRTIGIPATPIPTTSSSAVPFGPRPTAPRESAAAVKRDMSAVIVHRLDDCFPQPAEVWALSDDSEVGGIVSPITMRRLRLRWIRHRTGLDVTSPRAVYYPSIRGFAQRHARRLTALCPELGPRVQHRIEGFLQLDDEEFNACYNYLGDPTPEYLQLSQRLDAHPLHHGGEPSSTAPGDRQRRRAKARQLELPDRCSR